MTTDGIDFVDEDDAGRILLGLLEHVTDAGGTHADEHFDEVGTGNGKKGHIGLAGNRTGRQRLTGSGRTDEQHATRDLAAQALELLRIAQEFDDFLEVLLGFIHAGHIGERHATMRFGEKFGLRLAEAHCAARTTLHLTHEENPHTEDQEDRQPGDQITDERIRRIDFRTRGDVDILLGELRNQIGIARRIGLEVSAGVVVRAGDALADDRHVAHAARIDVRQELRVGDFPSGVPVGRALEHVEQRYQKQRDNGPECEIA